MISGASSQRQRNCGRAGRILRVMQAAQRADAADVRDGARASANRLHDLFRFHVEPVGQWPADRNARQALACALDPLGRGSAPAIIDIDHRGSLPLDARNRSLLHRGVLVQASVPVEVVRTDIDENADPGIKRGRQINLI